MLSTEATRLVVCPCGCEEVVEVYGDGSYRRPECGTTFRTVGPVPFVPGQRDGDATTVAACACGGTRGSVYVDGSHVRPECCGTLAGA